MAASAYFRFSSCGSELRSLSARHDRRRALRRFEGRRQFPPDLHGLLPIRDPERGSSILGGNSPSS
jgi:hypothetical protein